MDSKKSILVTINPIKLMSYLKNDLNVLPKRENPLLQLIDYLESNHDLIFTSLSQILMSEEITILFIHKYSDYIIKIDKIDKSNDN